MPRGEHPFSPTTSARLANMVKLGLLKNTTGRSMTRGNFFGSYKADKHLVYFVTIKGKLVKRTFVVPPMVKMTGPVKKPNPNVFYTPSPVVAKKKRTRSKSTHGMGRGLVGLAAGMFKPRRGVYTATSYSNRKHRGFMHTGLGAYVIREAGKSLYSRKARYDHGALITSLGVIPFKIRPKRVPRK